MSTGRRPHDERHKKKTFYLPESLVSKVDLMLDSDLLRGTPKHGAWSALIAQLLRDWVIETGGAAEAAASPNIGEEKHAD